MNANQTIVPAGRQPAKSFQRAEIKARRAIEDHCDLLVQDANLILQANCPNADLVVFGREAPIYLQVKSSEKPAGKDCRRLALDPGTAL